MTIVRTTVAAAAVLLCTSCAMGAAGTTVSAKAPAWRNVPTPAPLRPGALNQIDVAGPGKAWAVGIEGSGHIPGTAIFRWNRGRWNRQASPVQFAPTDVAAGGKGRAWAVGLNAFGPVAVHWTGTKWIKSPFPGKAGTPNAVSAAPDGSAWAVSQNPYKGTTTLLRWGGVKPGWTAYRVALPAKAQLSTVTVRSRKDLWIGGSAGNRPLVMHFNGTKWRRVAVPAPAGGQAGETGIARIVPMSPSNVWALRGPRASALLHWNGQAWTEHPLPGGIGALSLAEDGRGGAWVVPFTDSKATRSYYLHWNGQAWTKVYGPVRNGNAQLGDIDRVPGGTALLGVGAIQQKGRRIPFTERYG